MSEMRDAVAGLKLALDEIESELGRPEMSLQALESFKVMVDNVRTSVLAALTAEDPTEFKSFVYKFRLRRAAQTCQGVLYGLVDGTIDATTPGFDDFRSTVDETLERLDRSTG